MAKHIRGNAAEWDEVVSLAAAAYNFFDCQAAGESPFCNHVWQGSHHPIRKTVGASPKVLGRLWGSSENGFVKETLFADSREREMSKRRARSHRKYKERGHFQGK